MLEPYTIERLAYDDINDFFDFRQRVFPVNDKQMNRKRWCWLFQNNPYIDASLLIWVIKTHDRIAGSIGVIPLRCIVGDESVMASMGVDFFVEDSFKGLPALQLLKKAMAENPIFIGANISQSARKLFLKMGGSDLSLHLYTGIVYLSSAKSRLLSIPQRLKTWLRWTASFCLKIAGYRTVITQQVPDDYHDLWSRIAHDLTCGIVKDTAYLQWRYEQNPILDYHFITSWRKNKICALMAVAIPHREGMGLLFDIIVPHGDYLALMSVLSGTLKYLQEQNCHAGGMHWNAAWAKPLLYLFGFNLRNSDLGHIVRVANGAERFKIMQQPGKCTFSLGDTDRY